MNIEYKLFDNETAVILSRQADVAYDTLVICFADVPEGTTAIIESEGASLYRQLDDGECSVPVGKLNGVVTVTVAMLDGSARTRKWKCEALFARKLRDGGTLISPNDMNMPQKFIELKMENEEIRKSNKQIEDRLSTLEDKLVRLLEGYDLT